MQKLSTVAFFFFEVPSWDTKRKDYTDYKIKTGNCYKLNMDYYLHNIYKLLFGFRTIRIKSEENLKKYWEMIRDVINKDHRCTARGKLVKMLSMTVWECGVILVAFVNIWINEQEVILL